MNRIESIGKIVKYSSIFVNEVEGFNALNQYHINIHAENFLVPVLNEVFGLSLENLNATQKKNFPAIDLADFANRVAFQITATSTSDKITESLKTFFKFELHKLFDVIYFYIITHKKPRYSESKLKEIVPSGFHFSPSDHIIDKDDILKLINQLSSTPKIQSIAKLYELEFSDVQLENRKKLFTSGYLSNEPEKIIPNLLKITFPATFYKAELNINEEDLSSELNESLVANGRKPKKKFWKEKLVKHQLKKLGAKCEDWLLFENCLYTFKDISNIGEPLNKVIDNGTVIEIRCEDFYGRNDDNMKVFKHLLRKTFGEYCKIKGIEWYGRKKIFRFANNQNNPSTKKIKWRGKKEATKTVIAEIRSKKDNHLICYRSLAFHCSFISIDDDWFMIINPTWSFTNADGYRQSRYESSYMSGIKKLENNNSVYNCFRIIVFYLADTELFHEKYPYINLVQTATLNMSPQLDEKKWKQVKSVVSTGDIVEMDLLKDNELFDNSYFE